MNTVLSNSVIVENIIKLSSRNQKNQKQHVYKWIDDNLVTKCQQCKKEFSFVNRKHHCRACGRIFCHDCSKNNIIIPEDYSCLQSENIGLLQYIYGNSKSKRVCDPCYHSIVAYNTVNDVIMKNFNIIDIDIDMLHTIKQVCKIWNIYAEYQLTVFKNIKYVLPNHTFTNLQKKLLWNNYYNLVNHPKYLLQLLKSIDTDKYTERKNKLNLVLKTITNYNNEKSNTCCKKLMCDKSCTKKTILACEDAIMLLGNNVNFDEIREFAINSFNESNYDELKCYISFLVFSMKYESIGNNVIGKFFINRCVNDNVNRNELVMEIYWDLVVQIEIKDSPVIYRYFLDQFKNDILKRFNLLDRLESGHRGVTLLNSLKSKSKSVQDQIQMIPNKINLPIDGKTDHYILDQKNISIKDSATLPIVLPLTYIENKKEFTKNIMYKFDDVRRDQIIMSIIHLTEYLLNKYEGIEMSLVTYKIRPTGINSGLIELVPDSHTIYHVKETKKVSLLNHILNYDPNKTVSDIRNKFLKSCAGYSVLTYVLGIGDRHLDNIMITHDGVLFHIDYSYILGDDPKPIVNSCMRISPDMIDVIGGVDGPHYKEFVNLCTKIYNGIRKYVNLYITLLSTILDGQTQFTKERLYDQIIQRFSPGENYKQAEIQMSSIISMSSTYKYGIIDILHSYGKYRTTTTGKGMFDTFLGFIGYQ